MYYRPYRGKKTLRFSPVLALILAALLLCAAILAAVFLRPAPDKPSTGQPSQTPNSAAPSSGGPASPSFSPSLSSSLPEPVELPWNLTLVNASHPLPEDFAVVTKTLVNGEGFDARAFDALTEMLGDCQAAGLQPLVCSAYRSTQTQEVLFQRQVDYYMAGGSSSEDAYAAAAKEIAVPGTSEHSLGLAADIVDAAHQVLDRSQENTAVQKWLMEHCWEYGFILRYPNDKSEITEIIYEPWHYRYVGKEDAKAIADSGLCLEEYLTQEYGIE